MNSTTKPTLSPSELMEKLRVGLKDPALWFANTNVYLSSVDALFTQAADALQSFLAEEERLRKALEPFAEFVDASNTWLADNTPITGGSPMARRQLTVGDCRRARAALALQIKEQSNGPPLPDTPALDVVEALAMRFHEVYERLAPEFSYKTRKASAVPWAEVPSANKQLMRAVAAEILASPDALLSASAKTPAPDVGELIERLKDAATRFLAWAYQKPYGGASIISIPRTPGNIDCILEEAASALLSASAEIERLREERDEFERRSDEWQNKYVEEAFAEEGAAPVLWSTVAERWKSVAQAAAVEKEAMRVERDVWKERAHGYELRLGNLGRDLTNSEARAQSLQQRLAEVEKEKDAALFNGNTDAKWGWAWRTKALAAEALLAEAREMISYAARNGSHAVELACDDFLRKLTPTDPAEDAKS